MRSKFTVFDPSGRWMSRWRQQFAALEIPHLRSPAVHHPDPNAFGLRKFAESRSSELFAPYDLPGTKLFDDFCTDVISRWDLNNQVHQNAVTQIIPGVNCFRIHLQDGQSISAKRVVLATGGANGTS